MPRTQLKVGTSIWVKFEHHFYYYPYRVHSETSRSWVILPEGKDYDKFCESEWYVKQVGKKLPKASEGIAWVLGTKEDADLAAWAGEHKRYVSACLEGQDAAMLLQVARLIGYTKLPGGPNEESGIGTSKG